jgi:hypothetical protein
MYQIWQNMGGAEFWDMFSYYFILHTYTNSGHTGLPKKVSFAEFFNRTISK